MTEREAWLKIAEEWKEVVQFRDYKHVYFTKKYGSTGLCMSIDNISINYPSLQFSTVKRMKGKIRELPNFDKLPDNFGCFKWPLTKKGARMRRSFCLKQAKLCLEEEKKKTQE